VIKLTADPAFERALRWGLTDSDMAAFQRRAGARIAALRAVRDLALSRASLVLFASRALQELAISWGLSPEKTRLLPNPIEAPAGLESQLDVRRRLGLDGRALVFAGRLVPQKAVEIALEAVHRNDDVTLVVAGDGPERESLERRARELGLNGRARFLGPQPRRTVFELLRAADGGVLSSSWENFPHLAIESLAVGTPVLATAVGGIGEIVRHDRNGLLVPAGSAEALGAAIGRYFGEAGLQHRLRACATESVARFQPQSIYERLEGALAGAA
jgi:glycosyltransferase involved in cell wall biosynthesis